MQGHFKIVGHFDHMIVRYNITVRRDNYTRTFAFPTPRTSKKVVTKEKAERISSASFPSSGLGKICTLLDTYMHYRWHCFICSRYKIIRHVRIRTFKLCS